MLQQTLKRGNVGEVAVVHRRTRVSKPLDGQNIIF